MTKLCCAINCGGLCKPKVVKHGLRSGNAVDLTETKVLSDLISLFKKRYSKKAPIFALYSIKATKTKQNIG